MSELRLVLTNSCDFKCFFCHAEGSKGKSDTKLNASDYKYLFLKSYKVLNTNYISLTGGEPTIRKDIVGIVKQLYEAGAHITMTSNFSILDRHMAMGKYINKMNISFHSFDNKRLSEIICVRFKVDELMDNVRKYVREYPKVKVCLNCTVTEKNSDLENIQKMIDFANEVNANVNFSELYSENTDEVIRIERLEEILIKEGFVEEDYIYGRSRVFVRDGQKVKLSKILCVAAKENDNPDKYCNKHRDLFISPDGKIDICRERNIAIDILNAIKNRNDAKVIEGLKEAKELLGCGCKKEKVRDNEQHFIRSRADTIVR